MDQGPTLILAALVAELRPVARRLGLRPERRSATPAWVGQVGQAAAVAAATGVGRSRASAAADECIQRYLPRRVLITGTAGATNPSFDIAHILVPSFVIDAST